MVFGIGYWHRGIISDVYILLRRHIKFTLISNKHQYRIPNTQYHLTEYRSKRIVLIFSEHEESRHFINNYIDSFRIECFDYTDDHVCCGRPECGASDADNGFANSCRGYPDITFSDHFSILVFETVVSGRLDTHTHIDQQSFMGWWNLFFGYLL